jgi:RNA polymerase sigma factor (sigma-70 family)
MHRLWPEVEACVPQLWRTVCGYELNPALREDLLQEVLLAIWQALPGLRDVDRLLPFVLRIAHNLGASHVRSATRRPAPLPFEEAAHGNIGRGAGHEAGDERSDWLFEAMSHLPVHLRQPLMLQLEGFDYQDIAAVLGLSPENVGVRIHRGRARLKAMLREEQSDES